MEQNAAYEGQQVYHPKGWWGHYVFSQDHKIIALQYTCVALALSLIHISAPTRLLSIS